MNNASGYTFTNDELERRKAQDAKMTPEERLAVSKALVEANTEANAAIIEQFSQKENRLTGDENEMPE